MKPVHFSLMRTCLAALAGLGGAALTLCAQTNPPPAPGRYLFIVDTSAAMKRYAPAAYKAVENLLLSSMSAQLKRGDTVGVWTFNEQLFAGRLPLQVWSPETAALVNTNVLSFLKTQAFSGASRFETVVPTLSRVVENSDRLTVLLVSDGNEEISGTPFDWQIQTALGNSFKAQQKARMPFITVLRAQHGEFVNAFVNRAPWPVEFPQFPPESKTAVAPKVTPQPKPLVTNTTPPLILIGKKPEPTVETNVLPALPPQIPEAQPTPAPQPGPPVAATPTNPVTTVVALKDETNSPIATAPESNLNAIAAPTPPSDTATGAAITTEPVQPAAPSPAGRVPAEPVPAVNQLATAHWIMICGGVVMVLMAVVIVILVVQRGHARGESSLITRSLDQEKK